MAAVDMIDNFLNERGCTLWGRAFDIVDPDGRRNAARWFQKQVEDFYTFNSGVPVQIADAEADERIAELESQVAHLKGVAYASSDGSRSWRDVAESQRLTIANLRAELEGVKP